MFYLNLNEELFGGILGNQGYQSLSSHYKLFHHSMDRWRLDNQDVLNEFLFDGFFQF